MNRRGLCCQYLSFNNHGAIADSGNPALGAEAAGVKRPRQGRTPW